MTKTALTEDSPTPEPLATTPNAIRKQGTASSPPGKASRRQPGKPDNQQTEGAIQRRALCDGG